MSQKEKKKRQLLDC